MFFTFAHVMPLLLLPLTFAQTPALWDVVDAKVRQESICHAFIDGAAYTFRRKSCSAFGCDQWDYVVKTYCRESSDGAFVATVEHWKNGEVFSREELPEPDWERIHGNLLRSKAIFAESFGQTFSLDRVDEVEPGLLRATYTIRSGSTVKEEGYWLLGGGPTIPQIRERHAVQYSVFKEETSDILVP